MVILRDIITLGQKNDFVIIQKVGQGNEGLTDLWKELGYENPPLFSVREKIFFLILAVFYSLPDKLRKQVIQGL